MERFGEGHPEKSMWNKWGRLAHSVRRAIPVVPSFLVATKRSSLGCNSPKISFDGSKWELIVLVNLFKYQPIKVLLGLKQSFKILMLAFMIL